MARELRTQDKIRRCLRMSGITAIRVLTKARDKLARLTSVCWTQEAASQVASVAFGAIFWRASVVPFSSRDSACV